MEAGQEYGKYQLLRRLATGGMAEVFLARQAGPSGFAKTVVIKRMLPHLTEDPIFVEMFLHEARIVAALSHPNIVQVFDLGELGGTYFLAMEFVEGMNLRTLLNRTQKAGNPIAIPLAVRMVADACEGMAYAHAFTDPATGEPLGLVHRDLSPENILVSAQGAVKVVDFGVARISSQPKFTRTGMLKGKLAYMAPEQLHAEPIDLQLDVFALGVVLYEMVCGHRPFEGPSEAAVIRAILDDEPAPLESRRHGVSPELARIVRTALAKKKPERYPDCAALKADLDRLLANEGGSPPSSELGALVRPLMDQRPPTQSGLAPIGSLGPQVLPTPAGRTDPGEQVPTATMDGAATAVHRVPRKPAEPQPEADGVGQFTISFEGTAENLLARITARYGEHAVAVEPGASDFAVVTHAGRRTMIKRAPEHEAAAIHAATALGLRFKPVLGRFHIGGDAALELLANAQSRLPSVWKVELGKVRFAALPPVELALKIDADAGGFSLTPHFQSGSLEITPAQVYEAHRARRRHVKLAEGYAPLGALGAGLDLLVAVGAHPQTEEVRKLLAEVPSAELSPAARERLG